MRVIKEKAYAKINLFLDVTSKRQDGFHDIKTVMHSVSLSDVVTLCAVEAKAPSVSLTVKGNPNLVSDDRNLVVRAANLFMSRAAINAHISITLEKKIPIAAGLAGGSSDAAATLRGMNKLFSRCFSDRALQSLGTELGSDIPYCLIGGTALCEGRGEIITRLPKILPLHTVIAVANEYVSTPSAYADLDKIYSNFDGTRKNVGDKVISALMNSLAARRFDPAFSYNVFEDAVLPRAKGATEIKRLLSELGAQSALMSGSGPSVFGIFETEELAKLAESAIRERGYRAYYAMSV